MNLAVSVQSDWDYLRVCFSDWPFWAIIYFLLNCAFKLKHSFKKTPSIPWDSEEFSQVIWPKQSFNFTFNFTENSLESERYSKLDRIRDHFGHTSKAQKEIKTGRKSLYNRKYTYQWPIYLKRTFSRNWSILYMRCSHRSLLSALWNHCLWISTRIQSIQNRKDDTTFWGSLLWKSYLRSVQMPSTIKCMMPWLWLVQWPSVQVWLRIP